MLVERVRVRVLGCWGGGKWGRGSGEREVGKWGVGEFS